MQSDAWAVVQHGEINIKTVSPSRRAAIVNWLHVEQGIMCTVLADDLQIERAWKQLSAPSGAKVHQVIVVADAGGTADG